MPEVICAQCGHRNAPGANFCSSCGAGLPPVADDHPTITFQIDQPDLAGEVRIELDEIPAGGLLVVRVGPNAGSRFALDKDVITVGRHPASDIFLDDITVSRRHVELIERPSGYTVRDVGSLNGTYLNRERIDEAPLEHGDELQVGKFKLVYVRPPEPGA